MDSLLAEIEDVFRQVFFDDQLALSESMTAEDLEAWDSLNHLNLMIALERRFGIKFATAEISRLKDAGQNVGNLVALVRSKRR